MQAPRRASFVNELSQTCLIGVESPPAGSAQLHRALAACEWPCTVRLTRPALRRPVPIRPKHYHVAATCPADSAPAADRPRVAVPNTSMKVAVEGSGQGMVAFSACCGPLHRIAALSSPSAAIRTTQARSTRADVPAVDGCASAVPRITAEYLTNIRRSPTTRRLPSAA